MKILNGLTLTSALSLGNGVGSSGQVLTSQGASAVPIWTTISGGAGGSGTVTSVDMTVPSILSVSGNPITSSGTFALSLSNQNANLIFAGPSTGSASAPAFRSLVLADLPTSGVVAGIYKSVTIDDRGRVTSGTNPTTLSGYGITDALDTSATGQTKSGALNILGNVGIGTASPSTKLDVSGVVSATGFSTSGSVLVGKGSANGLTVGDVATNSNALIRLQGTSNGYNFLLGNNVNVSAFELTPSTVVGGTTYSNNVYSVTGLGLHKWSAGGNETMRLTTTGGLAIGGGFNPQAGTVLDIAGGFSARGATNAGADFLILPDATTGVSGVVLDTSFVSGGYGPLKFNLSGSEKMRITAAGNVGINNTTPAYKLHIGETITTADAANLFGITTASGGVFSIGVNDRSAANPTWNLTTGTSESLSIVQGSNTRLFMDGAGRFVAGTSLLSLPSWGANNTYNANGYINIKGSGEQNITLQTTDSNNTVSKFFTGNTAWGLWNDGTAVKPFVVGGYQTEWMRITSDNSGASFNIGIGTTSPSTALQVVGTVTGTTFSGALSGNATTATTLQTARAIALSGDATGSANFDGSAGITISTTLANSGVTSGSYGSGTQVGIFTVDSKGRLTSASNTAISSATLSGDVVNTAVTPGATTTVTLSTVNSNVGTYGSGGTLISTPTVDAKGRITAISNTAIAAATLTGDISNVSVLPGATTTITLNTVNSNVGSFGSSIAIPVVTVNGKGLVTAVSTIAPKTPSLNDVTTVGATTSSTITINNTTQSTGSTNGALIVSGGLGVAKDTYIAGQLTIGGTLNVGGTLITTGVSTLIVDDSIIYMAQNNSGNVVDIGTVGAFNNGTYQHTGLVRRATDGKWYLFSGVTYEPTSTINFSTYTVDTLKANLEGNITGNAATVTNGLYSTSTYSNPSWLTGLSWSKILGTPTTLSGYGITDALNATNTSLKRVDSVSEGGQINFNRPSDDTMYWALDTYGTSTAPSFRLLETTNLRLQIDPGGAFKFNGSAGSSGQVLTSQGTSSTPIWTTVSGGGSGSVTSVDMTVPSILAVSGNPITSAGTFALSLANQNANLVFAGPSTGAATTPAFRSLVAADIPNLGSSYLSLSGGTLTGRLVISSGGASITGGITSISDISVNGVNIGAGPSTNAYNTKIGVSALNGISTGTYNIAIGYQALYGTTTASDIVAIGKNALYSATNTVSGIVAIGASALTANTSGINNVAIGYQTLKANTSGNYNTALGYNAVSSTTTSAQQTGIGSRSLQNNTGSGNTAVGENTISATGAGSNNSALGVSALAANTSGTNNTGIGSISLNANTTGSYNVAIGRSALAGSTSTSYNIAIGYNSLSGVSNTVSNLVAIGQSTLALNTTGTNNTAIGDQALSANLDGYSNIAIGNSALKVNTTGSNNTVIGHQAGFNITTGSSNTIIGMLAGVTNISDTVLIGAGTTERLRIDSNGNVGIGISSPTGDDKAIHIHGTTASSIHLTNSTTGTALGDGSDITAYGSDFIIRNREVGSILFRTQNADMANIDSVGSFTINSQNYSSGALSIGTGTATGTQYIKLRTSDSEAHITYTNGDGSTSGVKFQNYNGSPIPITAQAVNLTSAPTSSSHAVPKSYADDIMAIAWLGL